MGNVFQDHLVCFFGGTLALAAQNGFPEEYMTIGRQLTETCHEMYQRMATGLSPEIVYFNMVPSGKEDLYVKAGKPTFWFPLKNVLIDDDVVEW